MQISHGWTQKNVSSADGHRSYTTTSRGAGNTGSKRRRRIVGLVAAFRKETAQADIEECHTLYYKKDYMSREKYIVMDYYRLEISFTELSCHGMDT